MQVLISMEEKQLPPNLHYNTPNTDIPALTDGRLHVVTEPTQWNGGYTAINSFGFGGANVHVILNSNKGGDETPATHHAAEVTSKSQCVHVYKF